MSFLPETQTTSIATHTNDDIFIRDKSLCRELIGTLSFTEMIVFQMLGRVPTKAQTAVLDACLRQILTVLHAFFIGVEAERLRGVGEHFLRHGPPEVGQRSAGHDDRHADVGVVNLLTQAVANGVHSVLGRAVDLT